MLRYEALMLAVPEITQDETKNIESQIEGVVSAAKGAMLSFERWGKYRLAYPINKNEYGVYFLARFEIADNSTQLLQNLQNLFLVKLNDLSMRHVVYRLDPKAPLTYQRPHSLEEAPAKMEGFFGNQRTGRSQDMSDVDEEGMSHD